MTPGFYLCYAAFCTAFWLINIFVNMKANFYLTVRRRKVILLSLLTAIKEKRCVGFFWFVFFILLSHFHLFIAFLNNKSEHNLSSYLLFSVCFHDHELLELLCYIKNTVLYV